MTASKGCDFLQYRAITLADKEQAEDCIAASGSMACHTSFVNLYMWRKVFPSEIAFSDRFLFRRAKQKGETRHYFPLGQGDLDKAFEKILEQDSNPVFVGLSKEQTEILSHRLPHLNYTFTEFRDNADYIYETKALISLSGKKLHSKKNHLNRFMRTYEGRWETVPISSENLHLVRAFHKEWCKKNGCKGCKSGKSLHGEYCAVMEALEEYDALGLKGLLLFVDGKPAAYSFASKINDRLADVHVEKADTEIDGSYTVINQQMAKKVLSSFPYVNREEDMGIPGLRKAKESYRPAILLMMHRGVPEALASAQITSEARSGVRVRAV